MGYKKIKNQKDKSLNVGYKKFIQWDKIFRKWIKDDFTEQFMKFKNCNEEVLKYRKRSSKNKIKNLQNWDKKYSKWDSRRSKLGR